MIWGIYSGIKVKFNYKTIKKIKFKNSTIYIYGFPIGGDILDSSTHENVVYSDNSQRITVDTDWADGLTSRFLQNLIYFIYSFNSNNFGYFTD